MVNQNAKQQHPPPSPYLSMTLWFGEGEAFTVTQHVNPQPSAKVLQRKALEALDDLFDAAGLEE